MRIAFCTTCKGRRGHLEKTLPQNLTDNADYPDAVFVLLDYNSPDDLPGYLKMHHARDIASGRLAVYSSPGQEKFRMAHAKNMAHRLGIIEGADVLVNLDADNFTGPGFATWIANQFQLAGDKPTFLWSRMVKGVMDRGINGRIAVTRAAFLNVGGYDEQFHTWSPDDKDFNLRLRRLGYVGAEIDPVFLHAIRHTDGMRFREYRHVSSHQGEYETEETIHDSDNTVANFGNIGTGVVYKNFDMDYPISLNPVPTRIFGIGMHKTATTSLHHAMKILGHDSAHWKSAHWAKAIYEEMVTMGRSPTLERSYALCDLPIPLLYKELDRAYPGSKFILTVRDEGKWLESVRRHWDPAFNKFRAMWSTDPFTHRVHKLVYGQKGFDAELFLARYRRHNAEVLEYFKGRCGDLLVMDMDKGTGAGWWELCGFLNQPIPTVPYPVAYASY